MTPKVSVLLAVHNGEPFVSDAVESVLAQTFEDFEFVVVDDASTDGTVAAVESFGDPRIRLLRNERNLGQVPSLNRGLHEARGEYIARIDADDRCRPERLARQVAILDAEQAVGLVGTWLEIVGERGRRLYWLRESLDDYVDFVFHTLIMRVQIPHPSALFRREPVLALGGYDESTGPAEDKDLWRRLALERWDARIAPEALVVYRLHDAQLSQTRAAYQRSVDRASQDRFLAALAPGQGLAGARDLLAGDDELWGTDAADSLGSLDLVLAGAGERLRLSESERRRLEQAVARHLAGVARRRPWSANGRVIAAWSYKRLPPRERVLLRLAHATAFATAPAARATRRLGRGAADASELVPLLGALRGPLRRSRLARIVYAKLVAPRAPRDNAG